MLRCLLLFFASLNVLPCAMPFNTAALVAPSGLQNASQSIFRVAMAAGSS